MSIQLIAKTGEKDRRAILWLIGVSALYFTVSLFFTFQRFTGFRSSAYDLGLFDQCMWLISRGLRPYSTLIDRDFLGDHGAWIGYLVAQLYRIYAHPLMLLVIQGAALTISGTLTYLIARELKASPQQSSICAIIFFLLPITCFSQLYDFHFEALAVPLILSAFLSAQKKRSIYFLTACILTIGCKEVLSLTIISFGVFLLFSIEQKRFGIIAILIGGVQGAVTILWVIPTINHGAYSSNIGFFARLLPRHLVHSPIFLFLS